MNIETANKLQKIRKEKGYTQESLADALGISRQAVSKWERAEASPDTDNLILLAKLYGVSLDELLDVDDETKLDIKNNNLDELKNEDRVSITDNGIELSSKGGGRVTINDDGVFINGKRKEETDPARRKKFHTIQAIVSSICVFGTIIAYILMGTLLNAWHPAWIIFFLIPIVSSIIEAIYKRRLHVFAFPLLVTAIYLIFGLVLNIGWHPWWFVFILIPVYYSICKPIDNMIKENHPNEYLYDIDYDEKDDKEDEDEDDD